MKRRIRSLSLFVAVTQTRTELSSDVIDVYCYVIGNVGCILPMILYIDGMV